MTKRKEVRQDDAAMPLIYGDGVGCEEGLTKREYMATQIFAAIVSGREGLNIKPETASTAIRFADYLIEALNEEG